MYFFVKRLFDLFFSFVLLVILSPLFLVIIILLKLTGEHEVFYFQERIGYQNKEFRIWKFATMLKNSPAIGTGEITLRNDPRVTPVGKFLRMSKMNELPQLINVLIGNMSFVGARPLMKKSYDLYDEGVKKIVYQTRPGITGIGSVIFRDEERVISQSNDVRAAYRQVFQYKGRLETWYQQQRNFYTDTCILFLTAWYIVFPHSRLVYRLFPSLPKREIAVSGLEV